ncbi:MAG TPA: hypothetical protein VFQ71_06570 [Gaiellales bacterium]|nr:hypothetical protein [Gaiellales bacterium]
MRSGTAIVIALVAMAIAPNADGAVLQLSGDANAQKPDIAVDDTGTAHVVWNVESPGDDTIAYCRVPRAAKSCASTASFTLPGDVSHQWVNVLGDGEVAVTAERCCFPGERLYLLTSSDRGASFSPPALIAESFYGWGEEVEVGPGDFSLSVAGGGGGCNDGVTFSAVPFGGLTTTWADLSGSCFQGEYSVSIAFPDPLTPLVAYRDWSTKRILFRRWSGSGAYNDPASWGAVTQVPGAGDEPKLGSGTRGVFLMFLGTRPPYQVHVRRYDGSNFPKSTDKIVSDRKSDESAIFPDFYEDGGGNLHAVFVQDDRTEKRALSHSASTDGGRSWQLSTLARGSPIEDLYDLRVGAAPDGGGAVVGDHNDKGPIWLAPFPPLSAGRGGACAPTVKVGGATVQALQGCFKHKGGEWVAGGPVKLNGVDIEPAGAGAGAGAAAAFSVAATPGQRRLVSSGPATVRAGNVVLNRGPVAWRLPGGDGKVRRLDSADSSVFPDLGKFAKKLFEFPVEGDAELLIAGKGTKVPIHLRMPGLLGGVSGDTTLQTSAAGLKLGGLSIDVPVAAIGSGLAALRLADIRVTYDGQNRFSGTARVSLPPAYAGSIAEVELGFEDGQLSLLKVTPPPFEPTLPIVGSPPTPIVGLDRIAISYVRAPDSRRFQGDLFLLAGPKPAGLRAVTVDGSVALEFPISKPTTLTASGVLKLVKLPLVTASATYIVPSTFEFQGGYSVLGISGTVHGFVDLANKKFSASGSAKLGPLQGEAVITDSGFGACLDNPVGPDPGVSWEWGDVAPSPSCPGSALASSARTSRSRAGLSAAPRIRASVRGAGRRRAVRFRVRRIPGQRVTFAEQSARVYREIGSTGAARGSIRFRPAPGPGGRRSIVAIVERGGVPSAKLTVAHYRAPPARRPGRPRGVVAIRRGGHLVVRWTRARGARGYQVRVNLPRDGRRLLFFPPPKRHRLRVRGIERSDTARVAVAAIGYDLRPGREGHAGLKPARQRKRARRR